MLSQHFIYLSCIILKRVRIFEKVFPLDFQGVGLHESGPPATHCFCLLLKKVPMVQLNLIVTPPSTHMKNNVQDRGWGASPVFPRPVLVGLSVAFLHIVKGSNGNSVELDKAIGTAVVTVTLGRFPFWQSTFDGLSHTWASLLKIVLGGQTLRTGPTLLQV